MIDHRNGVDTRVFREVARLGERLETIAPKVIGTCSHPRIAMVIDVPAGYCDNSVRYQGADYRITGLCGLVHAKGAKVLAEYQNDFYKGYPALTKNGFGDGEAYYIASLNEPGFLRALYGEILKERGLGCGLQVRLTKGVTVNERSRTAEDGEPTGRIWFLQNFNRQPAVVELLAGYENVETGEKMTGKIELPSFACIVLLENR